MFFDKDIVNIFYNDEFYIMLIFGGGKNNNDDIFLINYFI